MECTTCDSKEQKWTYTLTDGSTIGLCEECGKILYGITPIYNDRIMELIRMKECVKFYKEMQKQKVLKR